ncbi:FkbM family methyltransferase [Helicobacter labetoulli]|uniref:FkbM family methyltransferase n=1 Tax=Helicobacter labetoulli TaxID=2315333 RepID=UPI0039ECD51D
MLSIPQSSPFRTIQDTKTYPDSYVVLEQLKKINKDIYIFGGIRGGMSLGSMVRDFCDRNSVEIKGHIVNKAFKNLTHFRGKEVFALEEWDTSKDVAIIIGMADVKAKAKMLKNLGFYNLFFINTFRDVSYLKGCTKGFAEYFNSHLCEFESTYYLLADNLSREVMKGYLQDRIYNNYDTLTSTQDSNAFFSDVLGLGVNEVMIDCGAYDGDTCLAFAKAVPNYSHIFALEPDTHILKKLKDNTASLRCSIIPKGAYHKQEILYFSEEDSGTSHATSNGNIKIECDSIDNLLSRERERERTEPI